MTSINLGFFASWHYSTSSGPGAVSLLNCIHTNTHTHLHTDTCTHQVTSNTACPWGGFHLPLFPDHGRKFSSTAITQVFLSVISKEGKLEQLCQDGHMGRNCTVIGRTYASDSAACTLMEPIVREQHIWECWLGEQEQMQPRCTPPHHSKVFPFHFTLT